jgi:two-component system response regulator AlgR
MKTEQMFKIAIVDDEAPARVRLRTLLDDIAHEFPHEVVAETGDAQEALRLMQSVKPDVILLDVQMPVMTGIEFAKALRAASGEGDRPQIIYITAYEEFALPAFEVQATDYLLKPVRASRLLESLRRVRARLPQPEINGSDDRRPARTSFSIMERGRVVMVPVSEVLFMKADQKYVSLHTPFRSYLIEDSLTSLEAEFPDRFVRVHRNALVRRSAIAGVEKVVQSVSRPNGDEKVSEGWQVLVAGCAEKLPVSRRQWSVIKPLVR